MIVITKEEAKYEIENIKDRIAAGEIFIHPTDTIYGVGCSAVNEAAVKKVRTIKKRQDKPFSVIAPSKNWILENCVVNAMAEKWIKKLPGPYTLILKLKNKDAVAKNVNPGLDSVGVRIPNHWIKDIVTAAGVPIITPSANISGKMFMTSMDDLDPELERGTHFAIYEGEKNGTPSQIVDLTKESEEVLRG